MIPSLQKAVSPFSELSEDVSEPGSRSRSNSGSSISSLNSDSFGIRACFQDLLPDWLFSCLQSIYDCLEACFYCFFSDEVEEVVEETTVDQYEQEKTILHIFRTAQRMIDRWESNVPTFYFRTYAILSLDSMSHDAPSTYEIHGLYDEQNRKEFSSHLVKLCAQAYQEKWIRDFDFAIALLQRTPNKFPVYFHLSDKRAFQDEIIVCHSNAEVQKVIQENSFIFRNFPQDVLLKEPSTNFVN
jgi:hypothetical protein